MTAPADDTRRLALMALLALWVAAWGLSVMQLLAEPTGDGFTRGMNRMSGFLGWQGVAGMIALSLWGVGRGFAKPSGIRRVSAVPLGLTLVLLLALAGAAIWRLSGQP